MGARKNCMIDEVVVEYAYSIFADKGAANASLADIAAACGISKGTLYYYYPNREKLLAVCAENCVKYMGDAILCWAESLSPEAEIAAVYTDLADIFSCDRADVKLMLSLFRYENEEIQKLMAEALSQRRIMIEVGALRLGRRYSERFAALASTILYTLIGAAATGAERERTLAALGQLLS